MTGTVPCPALPSEGAIGRYDEILRAHLDSAAYRFFSLRHNPRRMLGSLEFFLAHAAVDPPLVLDVGAGAFTLAFLLEQARDWEIISLDYHHGYAALYRDLVRSGLLRRTRFIIADLRRCGFRDGALGAIVAHDVLYEPALDLVPLVPRFAQWLAPGGTLYLDVWDERLRRLWRFAGRDMGFRRYDLNEVRHSLRQAGFVISAESAYFGSGGAISRGLRKVLYACTDLSNTRHFLARLTPQQGDGHRRTTGS